MFKKTMTPGVLAVALAATMLVGTATADAVLPTGLASGSEYQVLFVTSGGTTATSTNMLDYNNFVKQQAAQSPTLQALGATWTAVASTESVDAMDNCPTYAAIPIYNTNGVLVASGSAQFWNQNLSSPPDYDQFGTNLGAIPVWTGFVGSYYLGNTYPSSGLDCPPVNIGLAASTSEWLNSSVASSVNNFGLYALSSPVTVTPEPASLTLLGSALLGLAGVIYLRRRRAKA